MILISSSSPSKAEMMLAVADTLGLELVVMSVETAKVNHDMITSNFQNNYALTVSGHTKSRVTFANPSVLNTAKCSPRT